MSNWHLVIMAVVGVFSSANADLIFVDANCPGGNGSELDPYCSIQTAIDAAIHGDEIVVAPGTYFETINFLGKAITLRSSGGSDVTIISANGPEGTDSAVTCASGEGADTVLEGFALTDGTGTLVQVDPNNLLVLGGGMLSIDSSPTVTNCTFDGNSAALGGGMANAAPNDNSSPTVTNCTFSGNSASTGGGMWTYKGSLTVSNCTFITNTAEPSGGGGMVNHESSAVVTYCTFIANSTSSGGGGMLNIRANPTVTDCTFSGNSADFGGGMSNHESSAVVTYCTFEGNDTFLHGAGMLNVTSSPTVANCAFIGNMARGVGGGMIVGVAADDGSRPTVTDCTFSQNSADLGGGMYNAMGSPTITNCTFNGNAANQRGGGLYNVINSSTVINCTLSGNSAGEAGGGMYNASNGSPTVTNSILWDNNPEQIQGPATVAYSDVAGGFPGIGNINADPLFVDPAGGDLHLLPGSPCIDAANNIAVPSEITTDLDGNPRFVDDPYVVDTGIGDPPIVDMGVYELCPWDCGGDHDGNVGIVDFLGLLSQWDEVGTSCDFGLGDPGVGVNEFLDVLANWGPCP